MSELKKCPKCDENLSISSFYKDLTSDDNLSYYCKSCIKKYFKQFKKKERKKKISVS